MAILEPGATGSQLSDARLRLVLEHSRTIAFTLDLGYRVTWISEVVGMPVDAVLGRRIDEIAAPGEAVPFFEVGRRLLESGGSLDFEGWMTWLGVRRLYAIRATLELDAAGGPSGFLVAITDISALRAAQDEALVAAADLREARAALELALSETRTIAFGIGPDGAFAWMAGALASATTAVGQGARDIWPWLGEDVAGPAYARVLAGEVVEFDVEVPGPPAATFRVVLAPRRAEDGAITGIVGTASDVTAVREAERAIRRSKEELEDLVRERSAALTTSEERFRTSIDNLPDAFALFEARRDAAGRYVGATVLYANPAWNARLIAEGVDPVGRDLYEVLPDARNRLEKHRAVVETGTPDRYIIEIDTARGRSWHDIYLVPFRDGFISVDRDVSEMRAAQSALAESERRLRDVIEGVDAIVWDEDLETGHISVSAQSVDILGYPLAAWQEPDFWKDIVVKEDRERTVAALDGQEDVDIEYGAYHADGTIRRLRDRMTVVLDAEGRVVRRYGLTLDVTAFRELEVRAFTAERLEALGRLAGQIAHDVDNVLYGIGVFAQYAGRAYEQGQDPRPDLEQVVAALGHGSAMTRNLLDFARSRPGTPTRLDLSRVVEEFRPMMERFLGPSVSIEIAGVERPHPVLADRAALQQVLLNLTTNAAAAMPAGGRCTIALTRVRRPRRLERELPPGSYVQMEVADTGTGMPPEVLARVFEPFFTTKADGTGLGLPSVYGIVKAAGGTIEVESEPGRGSTFRILLPVHRGAGAPGVAGD